MSSLFLHRFAIAVIGAGLIAAWAAQPLTCAAGSPDDNLPIGAGNAYLHRFLPNDATAAATFNVRQFFASRLAKRAHLDKKAAAVDENGNECINPYTDLNRVTVAAGKDARPELILLHGKFDQTAIEGKILSASDVTIHEMDGRRVFGRVKIGQLFSLPRLADLLLSVAFMEHVTPMPIMSMPSDVRFFMAFANDDVMVLSAAKAAVVEVLNKAAGKAKTTLEGNALARLLAEVDPRQTFSVVALGKLLGGRDVDYVTGGVAVDNGISAKFLLTAENATAAQSVRNELQSHLDWLKDLCAAGIAQGSTEMTFMLNILDGVQNKVQSKTVSFKVEIAPGAAAMDKFLQFFADKP